MEEAWELAAVSNMNIFASWSGEYSKEIALVFREWLPKVIQGATVFVSPRDIGAGEPWLNRIITQLRESDYGIAFVTSVNKEKPWLQFESGALALQFDSTHITPILCDIDNSELEASNPLSNFQAVQLNKVGVEKLIFDMHSALSQSKLNEEQLRETVKVWESQLFEKLENIRKPKTRGKSSLAPKNPKAESTEVDMKNTLSDLVGEVRKLSVRIDDLDNKDVFIAGRRGSGKSTFLDGFKSAVIPSVMGGSAILSAVKGVESTAELESLKNAALEAAYKGSFILSKELVDAFNAKQEELNKNDK